MGKVAKKREAVRTSNNIAPTMGNQPSPTTLTEPTFTIASTPTMEVTGNENSVGEILTSAAINDNDNIQSNDEMEVDDENVNIKLIGNVPDNFREIAEATLIRLRARNTHISKQLVVLSTIMADPDAHQQVDQLAQQYSTLDRELQHNKTAIQGMQISINHLQESEQPIATLAVAPAATPEPSQGRLIKPTPDMPRFNLNPTSSNETNIVRVFMERFATHLDTLLGKETFERECHRYLIVLTAEDTYQQELKRRFSLMEGHIGWDLAEKTFLEVCLTKEERLENMRAMANVGREPKETFQKYASRIDRNARVYGIQDNNDMVIHQLIRSIHSDMYNLLLFKYQAKEPEATTFRSIATFCSYLKTLHGPDDCRIFALSEGVYRLEM
jgi:hypothetical protein